MQDGQNSEFALIKLYSEQLQEPYRMKLKQGTTLL